MPPNTAQQPTIAPKRAIAAERQRRWADQSSWSEMMEATAPRVPWWYVALAGVAITSMLGVLLSYGVGWPVQLGVVMLLLLGLQAVIRRTRP